MIRVVILGFGRVGSALFKSLNNTSEVSVIQVFNKSILPNVSFPRATNFTTQLSEVKQADVYIIAIPDDAVAPFSKQLPLTKSLVVHTSGGVSMSALKAHEQRGVFYPLQTFTKSRDVGFTEVPICIEAKHATDLKILRQLGEAISNKVVDISSEERQKLHLAAVFVNNFVNYMYTVSAEFLDVHNLNFDLLKPLIKETANKIDSMPPSEAQTGPAIRSDVKTIEKHLHLLADSPYKEIYSQLTEAIQNHGKKL